MLDKRIAICFPLIGSLATTLACGSDSPTAPTSPTSGPSVPTSLSVELSIGQLQGARTGLLEGDPAQQARRIAVSGRVIAEGGPVNGLSGNLTIRENSGTVLHERDLDALFADTPTLSPGADLVFDDIEIDFDVPFPGFDGAVGEALIEVTGRDEGGQEVSAGDMVNVSANDTTPVTGDCQPDDTTACAFDDRFKIDVDWRSSGSSGLGHVASGGRFFDGAEFFFLDPANTDLLVQILDNCSQNDHFWVFLGASTNVEFTVTVTDTATGVTRPYFNPLGTAAQATTDTEAFATCP